MGLLINLKEDFMTMSEYMFNFTFKDYKKFIGADTRLKVFDPNIQEIAKKSNVTQKEAAEVLGALIETIQKTVSKGKKVTLVGFGTFEPRKRAARNGRNPQTGKEIKIPAKTVPVFSAGKKFKEVVNGK